MMWNDQITSVLKLLNDVLDHNFVYTKVLIHPCREGLLLERDPSLIAFAGRLAIVRFSGAQF